MVEGRCRGRAVYMLRRCLNSTAKFVPADHGSNLNRRSERLGLLGFGSWPNAHLRSLIAPIKSGPSMPVPSTPINPWKLTMAILLHVMEFSHPHGNRVEQDLANWKAGRQGRQGRQISKIAAGQGVKQANVRNKSPLGSFGIVVSYLTRPVPLRNLTCQVTLWATDHLLSRGVPGRQKMGSTTYLPSLFSRAPTATPAKRIYKP
jgi:hypothetical protein